MAIKQIQLRGISRMPDDSISDNGALIHSVNLCNDGAGLHLIEKPQVLFNLGDGEECVFIHETPKYRHYIVTHGDVFVYYKHNGSGEYVMVYTGVKFVGELKAINSIGNTIVYSDSEGVKYALFSKDSGVYMALGSKPPFIDIEFGLESEFDYQPKVVDEHLESYGSAVYSRDNLNFANAPFPEFKGRVTIPPRYLLDNIGMGDWNKNVNFSLEDSRAGLPETGHLDEVVSDMSNIFMGQMNKFIANATDKNKFVFPFYVRYAYELYDGSEILHSYPVLMIPNSRGPMFAIDYRGSENIAGDGYLDGFYINRNSSGPDEVRISGRVYGFKSVLMHTFSMSQQQTQDISLWKDVVKGINIYVTAPVYTYDQSGKVWGWKNMDGEFDGDESAWDSYFNVGTIYGRTMPGQDYGTPKRRSYKDFFRRIASSQRNSSSPFICYDDYHKLPNYIMSLPEKEYEKVRENMEDGLQFFKVASYSIDELMNDGFAKDGAVDIKKNVLNTITNREQMTDDYHSHDTLTTETIYTYNKRVNLGGVERTLHSPINALVQQCKCVGDNAVVSMKMAFAVKDFGVTNYVVGQSVDSVTASEPMYIFYPNSKATEAYVKYIYADGNTKYKKYKLKECTNVEGAYWLFGLWQVDENITEISAIDFPSATDGVIEERGKVYNSNVENPFTFVATNINTVGDGSIRALCANTQSVNSYNFGYATMYAFTDKGIWGLKVNDTGGFQSVQPISRDVITEGTLPLPLGQSIVFLADNGVMRIDINSSLTKLMSGALYGVSDAEIVGIDKAISAVLPEEAENILRLMAGIGSANDYFWHNGSTKMVFDPRNWRVYFSNGFGSVVYSIKSDSWSQSLTSVDAGLNSWPKCELQSGRQIVSLDTNERYRKGMFVTRPVKTGAEIYANLAQTVVRGNFGVTNSDIKMVLFGSRDYSLHNIVGSSQNARLTRHHGSGYRSHIVAGFVDTDRERVISIDSITMDMMGTETNKLR